MAGPCATKRLRTAKAKLFCMNIQFLLITNFNSQDLVVIQYKFTRQKKKKTQFNFIVI